jgi:hypothetical protein
LSSRREIPRGMNIVLVNRKLNRKYTKKEIMNATPEELKKMVK